MKIGCPCRFYLNLSLFINGSHTICNKLKTFHGSKKLAFIFYSTNLLYNSQINNCRKICIEKIAALKRSNFKRYKELRRYIKPSIKMFYVVLPGTVM